MNQKLVSSVLAAVILGSVLARAIAAESKETDSKEVSKISYYREIRPILQANCQGCHQPAKAKGGYIMTEFKRLLSGGDTEGAAIVVAHPEKSALLKMITPQDGEVRMPKGKPPLMESEVALIQKWIPAGRGGRHTCRCETSL
jgi:mono/diheme cytochrome c family protein